MTALLKRHLAFLAVFPLLGLLFFLAIRDGNDWGGDFAIYVLEARNLTSHRALGESTFVTSAESMRSHPAVYPPVASLAIAPIYALRGIDYKNFKRELTFFVWLSLLFFYAFGLRRGVPPTMMAVLILLLGLAPLIFTLGSYVGSDALFLFVEGATILAIDAMYRRRWDELSPVSAACLVAALLTICYLTRAAGLALIAAFCVNELWRARGLRRFGVASIGFTAAALVMSGRFLYGASRQYGSQFVVNPRQWLANDLSYLQTPAVLWASAPAPLRYAISAAAVVLIALGFIRRMKTPGLVEFCIIAWLGMLTVYWSNDKRYVLPMLPYAEIYGAEALIFASLAIRRPAVRRRVLAGCAAVAICVSAINLRTLERTPIREGVTDPAFSGLSWFLQRNTAEDALILSWNPRIFALYTNRHSALYPQQARPEEFESRIPWAGRRYLIVHKSEDDEQRLGAYLRYAAPHLSNVFENAEFRVYVVGSS